MISQPNINSAFLQLEKEKEMLILKHLSNLDNNGLDVITLANLIGVQVQHLITPLSILQDKGFLYLRKYSLNESIQNSDINLLKKYRVFLTSNGVILKNFFKYLS